MRARAFRSSEWLLAVALSACSSAQTPPATGPDAPAPSAVEQESTDPAPPEATGPVGDIPAPQLPGSGEPGKADPVDGPGGNCSGQTCATPEQCIEYVGVAGPSTPLYTCGIPCRDGAANQGCPQGYSCESIPDGPRMCRKP